MRSFIFAYRGFIYAVRAEKNMRVHICFAFYVICGGFVAGISVAEWAGALICIGLVMGFECFNTALERLCDAVCPEKNKGIKIAKDLSAAAVLCAAAAAGVTGLVIFFQPEKLRRVGAFFTAQPVYSALILLTLIPLSLFVFRPERREY